MNLALFCIAAYLIGAIPCGIVLTKLTGGADIRQHGSGNIGATNVYRTAGATLGVLTLIGDALKGALPLWLAQTYIDATGWWLAAIALATFLGHCFPIYLGFKGGKGVATALGIYLVIRPMAVLIALLLFLFILWKSRFISLGSICAAALMPVLVWSMGGEIPLIVVTALIGLLVIWRHKANIDRIANGTENRFRLQSR